MLKVGEVKEIYEMKGSLATRALTESLASNQVGQL